MLKLAKGPCQVHGYHYPKPLRVVVHHILPLGMGGKNEAENEVDVCDTGHYNIHRILAKLGSTTPADPDGIKGMGTRKENSLAIRGFDEWVVAGKPGKLVYQLTHAEENQ